MLPSPHILFTAVEGTLLDAASRRYAPAEEALAELTRRRIPLVLVTHGTRAQLEPLRQKLEHAHPFITESGGGLFLPDGYFSLRVEGAVRAGRYLCVPFGKDSAAASAAVEEIAGEAGAGVVLCSQMSAREIAENSGQSVKEAESARQREFSEQFFFAGEAEAAALRFCEVAKRRGWQVRPGRPFWELSSGNDAGRAVRLLMRLYKAALRTRLSSVGIGSTAGDAPLLAAVDRPIVLPLRGGREFDAALAARVPRAAQGTAAGPAGWNQAVLDLL